MDSRGKPIDDGSDKRGAVEGRGRIVIPGGASHLDAASNDGKIVFCIMFPADCEMETITTEPPPAPTRPPADPKQPARVPGEKIPRKTDPDRMKFPVRDYLREGPGWRWGHPGNPRSISHAPRMENIVEVRESGDIFCLTRGNAWSEQSCVVHGTLDSTNLANAIRAVGLYVSDVYSSVVVFNAISVPAWGDSWIGIAWQGGLGNYIAWDRSVRRMARSNGEHVNRKGLGTPSVASVFGVEPSLGQQSSRYDISSAARLHSGSAGLHRSYYDEGG